MFLFRFFSTFLVLLTIVPLSAHAAYTVTPLVIDKELKKRDIVTETITLTNTGGSLVRIYPTVNEISVDEGGQMKSFIEPSMLDDRATSITAWLEITRGRIELKPGETREVTLTIRVHPEVGAGEYHAFIGFPQGSNRPEAEKAVLNGAVPGVIVRIGVDKVQNQFLRLERFAVEKFVKDSGEGEVSYTLNNPGNDPVVPKGEVIFYDNNGYEVSAIPVNSEGVSLAEGETVTFESAVPNNLKLGKYKAFLSVEYGKHLTASLHDTAFFYVLPLKWVIAIFAVVLMLAILFALYVHKKFDMDGDGDFDADDVMMFIRQGRSEAKDHDIDLTRKKHVE